MCGDFLVFMQPQEFTSSRSIGAVVVAEDARIIFNIHSSAPPWEHITYILYPAYIHLVMTTRRHGGGGG